MRTWSSPSRCDLDALNSLSCHWSRRCPMHMRRNVYLESFTNQYNLILLGFFLTMALVTWSAIPLIAAAGLELMYMALFPGTAMYHAYIEDKYAAINAEEARKLLTSRLDRLPPYQRAAVDELNHLIALTKENMRDNQSDQMFDSMATKLDRLRAQFLSMIELANSYHSYLSTVDEKHLSTQIAELEVKIPEASARLKRTQQDRLDILIKRQDRLKHVRENNAIARAQLDTVRDMMQFFYESSLTMDDPRGLSQQIDDLLIDVRVDRGDDARLRRLRGGDPRLRREVGAARERSNRSRLSTSIITELLGLMREEESDGSAHRR